ncbi:GOLPH3/VPS74 family protein [Nonomuraea sp. SBT364]|uniref:GOLPH3/VPS74 family protein n=1 Tax=Nonomuraea sp. SBT364 TaxID=1580530 RepID=UPI000ABDF094|nr:GPP34 family phosphoprotein [Nonomuraea sp. SBT364]
MTIAEEILLLAHSEDDGKQIITSMQLDPALGGALLAELAISERVRLTDKKVQVIDTTPLGDKELDAALTTIAEGKQRKAASWVQQLQSGKLRTRLLTRLARAGVLAEERAKVLGLFPTTRWPEADGRAEAEIRERVAAALGGAEPSARTAVLVAVMHAAKLDRKAFPGADRARVKEISEGAWAAEAVAQTIAAVNAAVAVAVTAATVTATS